MKVLLTSDIRDFDIKFDDFKIDIDVKPFIKVIKEFHPGNFFDLLTTFYPEVVALSSKNAISAYKFLTDVLSFDHHLVTISHSISQQVKAEQKSILVSKLVNTESLGELIISEHKSKRVLHINGNLRGSLLKDQLNVNGVKVERFQVYTTELIQPEINPEAYDIVIFLSYSAIDSFYKKYHLKDSAIAYVIGPKTAQYLKNFWEGKIQIAGESDLQFILNEIEKDYA